MNNRLKLVWKVTKGAFYFGCIGNTLVDLTGCPCEIDGLSMKPTLLHKDWVWVNYWTFRYSSLKRGDIVVFIKHSDPDRFVTKRIVGLEGDLIQNEKSANFHGSIVPKGHCWVEGDNYQVSEDSIKYGPISTGLILAKITHIFGLWPTFPFIVKRLTPYRNPEVSAGGTVVIANHVQVSALR